jgi:hypothetical protein
MSNRREPVNPEIRPFRDLSTLIDDPSGHDRPKVLIDPLKKLKSPVDFPQGTAFAAIII